MTARQGVAVAVISRVPRLGRSKTRLARTLGAKAALALHRSMVEDELEQLHDPERWDLFVLHDAPANAAEQEEIDGLRGGRAASLVPGEDGLARELFGGFRALLADYERAVIVSADVPQLEPEVVRRAVQALDDSDLVLGSGPDGGYYLVGLREPHDVFTPIGMGTPRVERATVALAGRLGLRVAHVAALTDIDEAQDLLELDHVPAAVARRTRELAGRLDRGPVALQLPTELQLEVTSRCNLKCSACLRTHEPLEADGDLTIADYRRIVGGLPSLERIAFQLNGEPLLCRDLFAMVREASAAGIDTVVNTNGTLLDARRRAEVLSCGLGELRVSLDGVKPQTVLRMAGASILDRVSEHVAALIRERGAARSPRISLWMIATRTSIGELSDLVRLAARLGVDEVYLQRLVLTGKGVAERAESLHGQVDDAVRRVIEEAQRVAAQTGVALRASGRRPLIESLTRSTDDNPQRGCWRPWRSAVVTADKRVLPCCIASFREPYDTLARGDLKGQTWDEIWNAAPYRELRQGLLDGEPLPSCAGCGVDWSL